MGDFVKGEPEQRVAPALARGVRLHRAIDAYTDSHAAVRHAARRFAAARRRYAGVAIDMAFDHFLALDWQATDPCGFEAARRNAYALLRRHHHALPERFQRVACAMAAQDWWASYTTLDGIGYALARMSERLSRPNALAGTVADIEREYRALRNDFDAFWPEAAAFAAAERTRLAARTAPWETGDGG
jgi:acyl carrier protein phosphodiesterase